MIFLLIVIGIFVGSFCVLLGVIIAERNVNVALNCLLSKYDLELKIEEREARIKKIVDSKK